MNHESINDELTMVVICGKNSMFLKSVTKPITLPKRIKYLRFHKKNFLFAMAATYPEGFCYRSTGMGSQILIPNKKLKILK